MESFLLPPSGQKVGKRMEPPAREESFQNFIIIVEVIYPRDCCQEVCCKDLQRVAAWGPGQKARLIKPEGLSSNNVIPPQEALGWDLAPERERAIPRKSVKRASAWHGPHRAPAERLRCLQTMFGFANDN